jgi:prevent-host-death family protein
MVKEVDHNMIERSAGKNAMQEIAISEFKAKCLAVLEQVRATKKPIRITRFGKPVAEVVPPSAVEDRKTWIGSMKDTMKITGDIVSPATDEDEWEVLRD